MGADYKTIRVQHYLRRWKMLEQNVNNLKPYEIEMGRLLFNSLPKIKGSDLELLKIKYYDSPNVASFDKDRAVYTSTMPVNDDVVAFNLGVTKDKYVADRRQAEKELEKAMLETGHKILYSKEQIFLKFNRFLYIKNVDIKKCHYIKDNFDMGDITLTSGVLMENKQVFDLSDSIVKKAVMRLESYGFQREALDQYELEELEGE